MAKLSGQEGGQPLNELPTQPVTMTSSAWSDVVPDEISASPERSSPIMVGGLEWFMNILVGCTTFLLTTETTYDLGRL